MKTMNTKKIIAALAATSLVLSAATVRAQDSTATVTVPPAIVNASAPPLAYGVSQILQLAQAKVGDDTIIAYIKSSGNSYGLNADQIIYLQQQGVSGPVITTMLNQPKPGVAASIVSAPAPAPAMISPEPVATATVDPTVTYVQTVPATTYYYQPYYYPAYDYYGYGYYPGVSLSFGWGGYWGHGYGYYGGHGGGGYGGSGHGGGGYGGGHGGGGHGGGHH